jgi:hypothetical protein
MFRLIESSLRYGKYAKSEWENNMGCSNMYLYKTGITTSLALIVNSLRLSKQCKKIEPAVTVFKILPLTVGASTLFLEQKTFGMSSSTLPPADLIPYSQKVLSAQVILHNFCLCRCILIKFQGLAG